MAVFTITSSWMPLAPGSFGGKSPASPLSSATGSSRSAKLAQRVTTAGISSESRLEEVLHLANAERRADGHECVERQIVLGHRGQHLVGDDRALAVGDDRHRLVLRQLQLVGQALADARAQAVAEEVRRGVGDEGLEERAADRLAQEARQRQHLRATPCRRCASGSSTPKSRISASAYCWASSSSSSSPASASSTPTSISSGDAGAAPTHGFRAGPSRRVHEIGPVRHAAARAEVLAEEGEIPFELESIRRRLRPDAMHIDDDGLGSVGVAAAAFLVAGGFFFAGEERVAIENTPSSGGGAMLGDWRCNDKV